MAGLSFCILPEQPTAAGAPAASSSRKIAVHYIGAKVVVATHPRLCGAGKGQGAVKKAGQVLPAAHAAAHHRLQQSPCHVCGAEGGTAAGEGQQSTVRAEAQGGRAGRHPAAAVTVVGLTAC